jgi:5-methylcytosine-specific restriction protein A
MPNRIASPCAQPGCPAVTQGGRCPKHQRAHQRAYAARPERRQAQQPYHTTAWRQLRAACLERDPYCWCGKRATEADHIVARAEGGSDTLENLRGMCKSHHSQKTVKAMHRDGERWV